MSVELKSVVILGGGLTGLAAAFPLEEQAVVFERATRPGGLARTESFNGYWFDRALHVLYFHDKHTECLIHEIAGDVLVRLAPVAWVETQQGTARFPLQLHLGDLKPGMTKRCLSGLGISIYEPSNPKASDFEQLLLQKFGEPMCELFFFPYNRKLWKRPLSELAPSGFQWNISSPTFEEALSGAVPSARTQKAYNSNGWYTRPQPGSGRRGMEILASALAGKVCDLRLRHTVESIDLDTHRVTIRHNGSSYSVGFKDACLATIPLPHLVSLCHPMPDDLIDACRNLKRNRVVMVAFSIRGPRPLGRGHWRYYADESLIFNRLIYMHEFDPLSAPDDGWGLMAEITERGEGPPSDSGTIIGTARDDIVRAGVLEGHDRIIDQHMWTIDPAYVVFSKGNSAIIRRLRRFLQGAGITTLGRYGSWGYSSMAQVMRSGLGWGNQTFHRLQGFHPNRAWEQYSLDRDGED